MIWQPIETAPRDRQILTFSTDEPDPDMAYNLTLWLDAPDKPGWYIAWDHSNFDAMGKPTHWMILPEPPE